MFTLTVGRQQCIQDIVNLFSVVCFCFFVDNLNMNLRLLNNQLQNLNKA
jgi:hypothetical protein